MELIGKKPPLKFFCFRVLIRWRLKVFTEQLLRSDEGDTQT
jgi:hypothetical protein